MTDYATPRLLKRQIKEKVQAILKNRTLAEDRVFVSRTIPTQYEEKDVILIYSQSESISRFDEAPKSYNRVMNLLIECISTGDDDVDLDKRLEEMGEAVEHYMEQDETLGGLINKLELSGSDYQAEPDAANPMGVLALRYNVDFFTWPNPDPNALEKLDQVNLDWKIGHHDDEADAVVDGQTELNLSE